MNETDKLLLANSPKGTDYLSIPDIPNPRFHPSPTMRVRLLGKDGQVVKVVALNRQQRRRAGLYGDRLRKMKP